MAEQAPLPTRRVILSAAVGIMGLYVLIAVLAYFVNYTEDLPALEGAPQATILNNPTGWIGAKIAHQLIYHGFGWIGILFPFMFLYAALSWSRGQKIRLKVLGWGLLVLYAFSTLGGWLVQIGWVEDLLWCGSVGAGLAAFLSLYIGPVGLILVWILIFGGAVGYFSGLFRKFLLASQRYNAVTPTQEESPSAIEDATQEGLTESHPSWYEVVRSPYPESPPPQPSPASEELPPEPAEDKHISSLSSDEVSKFISKEIPRESDKKTHNAGDVREIVMAISGLLEHEKESVGESIIPSVSDSLSIHIEGFSEPEVSVSAENVSSEGEAKPAVLSAQQALPPIELLVQKTEGGAPPITAQELEAHKNQIVQTLQHYGIQITRISATVGPTVTLFELIPAPGVRISKIKSLEDDIALSLAALGIRIIAPMPGKGTIGIEVPHARPQVVPLGSLISSQEFQHTAAILPLALGKTITNEVFIRDLAQMPHLLIAGATGQGKSVALNCMLLSLVYRLSPQEVRFVLIDPKKVEMSLYQDLEKHYLAEVPGLPERIITDVRHALPALQSLVLEMEMRYELLKEVQVRNIAEYNRRCVRGDVPEGHKPLPYIVLIIDELADLMMTAGKEVEGPICRLAQLARAVGIHLIVATQRPSVNVITGLIKANFPVRISFRVVSRVDSRVILDMDGAERLIGRGDMLFAMGTEVLRLQSGYVSASEIERVVRFIAGQPPVEPYVLPEPPTPEKETSEEAEALTERDPLFYEAALLVVRSRYGSTSLLQRKLGIGFNRAGRLMDQLERAGIVGPARGSKPRDVLVEDEQALQALL
ncbi:MAG: DNA translocase FtsK [Bacteroidia bacterium]|jgi:S-DNA-T family DNA segregation ATPase FtsK/SpoIIIE|nr:DNA translocase FtsK [Bacteroidia bacterium]